MTFSEFGRTEGNTAYNPLPPPPPQDISPPLPCCFKLTERKVVRGKLPHSEKTSVKVVLCERIFSR